MKKVLVLTEEQFSAVRNVVCDAIRSVNNDYCDSVSEMIDDIDCLSFAGTEMPSEHEALESIEWKEQVTDCKDSDLPVPYKPLSYMTAGDMVLEFAHGVAKVGKDISFYRNRIVDFMAIWADRHKGVSVSDVLSVTDSGDLIYKGDTICFDSATCFLTYSLEDLSDICGMISKYKPIWYVEVEGHDSEKGAGNLASYDDALEVARDYAKKLSTNLLASQIALGEDAHVHVHQYATPDSDKDNCIEIIDDADADCTQFVYRINIISR